MGLVAHAAQPLAESHAPAIRPAAAICSQLPGNACSLLRHAVARGNGLSEDEALRALREEAARTATRAAIAAARHAFVVLRWPFARGPLPPADAAVVGALTFTGFLPLLRTCAAPPARDPHFRSQSAFLRGRGHDGIIAVEAIDAAAPRPAARAGGAPAR